MTDRERLLSEAVTLLQDRFDLLVCFHLLDETTDNVTLRTSSDLTGQRSDDYCIALDADQDIVARAAREQETILVNDVTVESNLRSSTFQPQTRSVMVIPLLVRGKSAFLARHTRQGFVLFFAEVAALVFIWIIDSTIGRVPFLGLLILIALKLVLFLFFFAASVLGFMKAIFGQEWRIPYLDEIADKIPVDHDE